MPILSPPWGVTPAKIASRVQSLNLTATSSPSIEDVEEIIRENADWIAGLMESRGIGRDLDTEGTTLGIIRRTLYRLVIAEVDTLRGRKTTEMTALISEAEEMIKRIALGPQAMGTDAAASKNHRVFTSRSAEREIREYNDREAPLAVRLATRSKT